MKNCKQCGRKLGYRNKSGLCFKHVANMRTHGMSSSPEYKSWCGIKERCLNANNPKWKDYGGRGIKVCQSWHRFENFIEDMGKKPSKKHSVDRIDNDGNYEPDNCRWATQLQQARNKRDVKTYRGLNMSQWAKRLGLNPATIRSRIKVSGWSWKKATTTPKFKRGYRRKPQAEIKT